VDNKPKIATAKAPEAWTRPDEYLGALARRRTARKAREPKPRTQPEAPRFALSTLPFLLLMIGLLVVTIAVAIAAWPGSAPQPRPQAERHELGTAPKGWFQKAEREFHRQQR
jgi:hypothetical protein